MAAVTMHVFCLQKSGNKRKIKDQKSDLYVVGQAHFDRKKSSVRPFCSQIDSFQMFYNRLQQRATDRSDRAIVVKSQYM
jgi:hypothetical protein